MRILFLDQFDELGGAQLCLLDLLPRLRREGFVSHLALPGNGPFSERVRRTETAQLHHLPMRTYTAGRKTPADIAGLMADLFVLPRRIQELARDLRAELVYVNGPRLMPAVALARTALPVLFHSHNRVTAGNGKFLVDWAIRETGATVIAASRFAAKAWTRAHAVYSGVDGPPAGFRKKPLTRPAVGLIGRIEQHKCQRELVLAARDLPGIDFVIAGVPRSGDAAAHRYYEEVRCLAPPNVRFVGFKASVYDVLREVGLLVLPSADEGGFPRVVLEAFAARVPVLARSSGAVTEVLVEGRNGYLLSSIERSPLAARIHEVIDDQPRAESITREAFLQWRTQFTAARYADEITELLRNSATSPLLAAPGLAGT